ncbi:MAG: hypothetical protein ABIS21_05335, partial [Acidimicrobiales bacterium]
PTWQRLSITESDLWRCVVGGFLAEARSSAAREFGARHYRKFAAVAMARRVVPALSGAVIVLALLVGAMWIVDHGSGWWDAAGPWLPTVVGWILAPVALAATMAGGVWTWRNRWRWW